MEAGQSEVDELVESLPAIKRTVMNEMNEFIRDQYRYVTRRSGRSPGSFAALLNEPFFSEGVDTFREVLESRFVIAYSYHICHNHPTVPRSVQRGVAETLGNQLYGEYLRHYGAEPVKTTCHDWRTEGF